ncbi:hypothetical protein PFISCL1PPCAC_11395, partial [Pristionchus fissidentatus]
NHAVMGNPKKADNRVTNLHATLQRATKNGDLKNEAKVRRELGELLRAKGNCKKAIEHYTKAFELTEKDEKDDRLHLLNELIELHAEEGNYDECVKCLTVCEEES